MPIFGQVNLPANQSGTPINTSTIMHGADSVNTMGLGLIVAVPLLSIEERGRTYTWNYTYNSPTYDSTLRGRSIKRRRMHP